MQNVRYGMPPVKWGNNWFQSFNASLNYPSKYRRVCAWAVAHPTIPNPAFQTHRNKKKSGSPSVDKPMTIKTFRVPIKTIDHTHHL